MKEIITLCIEKIEKYFGHKLSADILEVYISELSKFTETQLHESLIWLMRNFEPTSAKPFPLIIDFLKAVGQDDKSMAVNVVTVLRKAMLKLGQYESVSFNDPALHSVINRYGGWIEMVLNDKDEWWGLHERNFINAYESACRSGLQGPEHLAGIFEIENLTKGLKCKSFYRICNKTGNLLEIPKRVSYDKMSEIEFKEYREKQDVQKISELLPNIA